MKLIKISKKTTNKADAQPFMKTLRIFRGDDVEAEESSLRQKWSREIHEIEFTKSSQEYKKEYDKLRNSAIELFEGKSNSPISAQELREFINALNEDIFSSPINFKNLKKKKKFFQQKGILVDDLINSLNHHAEIFSSRKKEISQNTKRDMEKVNNQYKKLIEELKFKDAKGESSSTLVNLARKFDGKVKGEKLIVEFTKSYKVEEGYGRDSVRANFSVYIEAEVNGDRVLLESNYNDQGGMEVTPQDEKTTKSFKDQKELEKIVEGFIKTSINKVKETVRYINHGG